MLAAFLIGITIGAAVAAKLASRVARARMALVISQIGVMLGSMLAYYVIILLAPKAVSLMQSEVSLFAPGNLIALAVLVPGAIFMGASFPLAVRVMSGDGEESAKLAGSAAGRVYSWNTIGAILGASIAGFVLLPTLEFADTLLFGVWLTLVMVLVASLGSRHADGRMVWPASISVGLLVALLIWPPQTPWAVLRVSPLGGVPSHGEMQYFAVAR